jgi:hypothetical protein
MDSTTKWPAWFVLTRHWLSLTGAALVTTAVISWLFVLPLQIRGHISNPYVGIVIFLIIPAIFFIGLLLMPIGVYLAKRRIRQGLTELAFDRRGALKRLAWFVGITTALNVLIGTQVTYRAVEHMETKQFCGATCHAMTPELSAFENSPHSRLECVECHVAPGASGWVASKASGTRQLFESVLGTYSRPIPSAIESNRLVPARDTCEHCHWPQRLGATRLRIITKYAEDEQNTRTQTVLMMMVGGSKFAGIHGKHFGPGISIRFAASDPKRQAIPWVEYRDTTAGKTTDFVSEGTASDSIQGLPIYEMQCVDCHNRPTHTFESASQGMDEAMVLGEIPTGLPFVKKKGTELLTANYTSSAEAAEKVPSALINFYQQNYADLYAKRSQDVQQAARAVLAIYNRNVFPDLKVTWGTYPNNLGHMDFPGCFRCHDGSHTSTEGASITQDCSTCHELLATDDASPEILRTLGLEERISKPQKQ